MTQTNFPSSLSEYYQYDADNNLTSKTDRKGQTITYLYDALNRLTSKTYPDTMAVDYVYDLGGLYHSHPGSSARNGRKPFAICGQW